MAKIRPSRLKDAAIALATMLAAVGGAVRGVFDRASPNSDGLEQDKAKSRSAARVIPKPDESRERCPPARGRLVTRRWHMSEISREYQARVTGFDPYMEWEFESIEFDGFRSTECRLQEAKAQYDQFFDSETGLPEYFFRIAGVGRMLAQARKQSLAVVNNPPARLTWYFMQPISHKFFSELFSKEKLQIESLLHP
ncbi:restriction endonuclease fold toxin 5 domain-containing protein [Trinickia fusca]|uniref:Tox-REase-5 domain-containing protein n=1 Tax=Trinickia fusca TaxID=2419777 RepID=A0A494X7T9_9BURK|nr:restriction endonuclease fold toxin 5 domain-containing protein [Trinickia fusca]RKP46352.1 hypothetical protein D7S89_17065 [Trinickia fusca]